MPTSASQELVLLPPAVIGQIEEIRLRCGQLPRILYGKTEKTLTRITTREDLQKLSIISSNFLIMHMRTTLPKDLSPSQEDIG